MTEKNYQEIYDCIEPTLTSDWKKISLYCAFWGTSCETKYYITTQTGEVIDCLQLPEFDAVFEAISAINQLFFDSRKDTESAQWFVISIVIDNTGFFSSHFDYSNDLNEQEDYFDLWKKQYIYEDNNNG